MKALKLFALATVIAVAGFVGNGSTAQKITIAGDPCSVPMAKMWAAPFTKKTGIEVAFTPGGCRSGLKAAADDAADIGVSTHNLTPRLMPDGTYNTVIGKSPVVMVVHPSNPVNDITREQLEEILSAKIVNWKEIGGPDMLIKNVLLPPCVTETMAFQASPSGAAINRLVPEVKGNPVTGTNVLVSKDPAAIGMQLYGYETPDVKVLKINGVLPTAETMPNRYTYYQNYNMTTKGEPQGAAKQFIEFALSPEGQKILEQKKHIPL